MGRAGVSARRLIALVCILLAAAALLGGCLNRKLKPLNPCLVSGVVAEIAVTNIDKVDMLFMVDNSNSMKEEQEALRTQFAHLISVLATGDKGDGSPPFPPAKDLHLGVVSSDMGLLGVDDVDNCSGFGDDGILQHDPHPEAINGCQASYPSYLSYVATVNDAMTSANDFACIASLGTGGCGFEQQLEAPLKALWPSMDPGAMGGMNRITFLGDSSGQGIFGHGDTDNLGFLRNDPTQGLSLIAIVLVTDEEDCSSSNTKHFTPPTYLDPNDPLAMQPLNLRCYYNQKNQNGDELYKLERYVNGFKALRPGAENLVIFAAITGVPPYLVTPEKLKAVDFTDQASRDSFYAGILNDPNMQEQVDPQSMTTPGTGNLVPSCQTDTGKAYPPRRIVEVAHQFGENGIVQSICQKDFGPALDAIIAIIAKQLGAVCLPRSLVRNKDGIVGCNVVWELPVPDSAPANTPTSCGQAGWEFLLDPGPDRENVSAKGGAVCKVAQLAVQGDATAGTLQYVATVNDGKMFDEGWYYDNFSESVKTECTGETKQRIAFSPHAKPPTGVTVKLECLNETQSLANTRTDIATNIEQPSIGDPCDSVQLNGQTVSGDAACQVRLSKPTKKWPDQVDKSMFCHPQLNVCVLGCNTSADCPPAWVCDSRADTKKLSGNRNLCVNPTCGDLK
jgi:hypothetical protein